MRHLLVLSLIALTLAPALASGKSLFQVFDFIWANPIAPEAQEEGTRTTYDWGQHTPTKGPNDGSRTTYDWGKHTASTYDWGQHTPTKGPNDGSRTTYDWGKHTASTYDWGQHTPTKGPNDGSRTTYDWGKHTASTYDWGKHTASTYDWGQHTVTTEPNDDHHGDDGNEHHGYQCGAGKYTCAGTVGLCIGLTQVCDTRVDCPNGDDENPAVCHFSQKPNHSKPRFANHFRGTGFMFQIRKMRIGGGSKAKLFNQDSDNQGA